MRTNQQNRLLANARRGKTTASQKVQSEFLTEAELETIRNYELPTPTLNHIRYTFLFQCVTGIRHEELRNITANNILAEPKTGMQYITLARKKTGVHSIIPLTSEASRIIDLFRGHPARAKNGPLIPVTTYPRYNYYLKQLADIMGFQKRLTTHCAIRTATTGFFNKGVSEESLSAMLGYSVKTLRLFTTPLPERVINDFMGNKITFKKTE